VESSTAEAEESVPEERHSEENVSKSETSAFTEEKFVSTTRPFARELEMFVQDIRDTAHRETDTATKRSVSEEEESDIARSSRHVISNVSIQEEDQDQDMHTSQSVLDGQSRN